MRAPTPDEINELPNHIREYVHQLETHDCDPQGDIRALMELRELTAQLTKKIELLRREES